MQRERPGCIPVKVSHMLDPLPSWYAAPSSYKGKKKIIIKSNRKTYFFARVTLYQCHPAMLPFHPLYIYIYIYIYRHIHTQCRTCINDRDSTILLLHTYLVSTWPCSKHKTSRKITPVETFNASKKIGQGHKVEEQMMMMNFHVWLLVALHSLQIPIYIVGHD